MFKLDSSARVFLCVVQTCENDNCTFCNSILGRIIRVTDDVIEYRQWIQRKFPVCPSPSVLLMEPSLANHGGRPSNSLDMAAVNTDSPSPPEERRSCKPRV